MRKRIIDRWLELESKSPSYSSGPTYRAQRPSSDAGMLLNYTEKSFSWSIKVEALAPKADALIDSRLLRMVHSVCAMQPNLCKYKRSVYSKHYMSAIGFTVDRWEQVVT